MRSELMAGRRVSTAMPSFVFLIAMPVFDREEALELSQRAAALLEQLLGEDRGEH